MRLDITKNELEVIVNCLKGSPLNCQQTLREHLARKLDWILTPSKAPDKGGWAPFREKPRIRSGWPTGAIKSGSKKNWAFHKPRTTVNKTPKPPRPPRKPLTAEEILAEL